MAGQVTAGLGGGFSCGCHDASHGLALPCAAPARRLDYMPKKTQVTASDVVSSHVSTKKSGERIAPRFSTQQKRGTVIISYMLLLCSPGISPKISNFRTRWRKWQRDLVLTIAGF